MTTHFEERRYVDVKDAFGNDLVCPLDALGASMLPDEDSLEDCVEKEVVGRYAGQLKMTGSSA